MKLLYKICLLYPYWFLKIILHTITTFLKTIFFYQIDEKKIDRLNGIEFEQLIKKLLIKNGYKQVKMTAHSGDFGIDILAKKNHLSYGFQCKRYQRNIGVEAIQQAKAGQSFYHLDKALVITNSYFTNAAFSLAYRNDIQLIDRTQLMKMMKKAKLMTSHIPFYYYLCILIIIIISYFLFYLYKNDYLLIMGIFFSFIFIFMIIKTLYYRSYNKEENYIIHQYNE